MNELVWVASVVVVVAIGVGAAARARRGRGRAGELVAALGLQAGPGAAAATADDDAARARHGTWRGRPIALHARPQQGLRATELRFELALAPAPLAYETLARALGRGDLLAGLHDFEARAREARLEGALPATTSVKGLRRRIDRLVALADALEAMPRAEGMARWFLDTASGADRADALQRLIAAYPDAPETLAACAHEREHPRDARAAEVARTHLAGRRVTGGL